ncbi:MAG: PadR family transcriptional regulator [Actinomycetes bacterium]
MATRSRSNALALAVLACLAERPMHPYEISTTLRTRGKHESIKLNFGSLYTVVERLAKQGLIAAQDTEREGRRPERTIYRITEAGRVEFADWLSDLISTPVNDFTQFEAALSLLPGLPPDEVVRLLRERARLLAYQLAQTEATVAFAAEQRLPRLFLVETEYRQTVRRAELQYVERLAADIAAGSLEGVDVWQKSYDDPSYDVAAEVEARMNRS